MADNALVTPIVWGTESAINERAQNHIQNTPRQIPVSITKIMGELVQVKAEMQGTPYKPFNIPQIEYPQLFSAWIREPTQVGDKGYLTNADFYLGGQSGLGGGVANFRGRANLTNMVFSPLSQKSFPSNPTRDLNSVFINGPNGAIIQDQHGNGIVQVDNTNKKITVNPKGGGWVVYLGGDGVTGTYAPVLCVGDVPCINVMGRTG